MKFYDTKEEAQANCPEGQRVFWFKCSDIKYAPAVVTSPQHAFAQFAVQCGLSYGVTDPKTTGGGAMLRAEIERLPSRDSDALPDLRGLVMKRLKHGMLLDAKSIMDDALPELHEIRRLVPDCLQTTLTNLLNAFEDTLCEADVADRYTEIERCR